MSEYRGNVGLREAAELVRGAGSVLILTHAKPDGDAFGAVVAMTAALRRMGKRVEARLVGPVPTALGRLPGAELCQVQQGRGPLPEVDLVVVLDSGAWSQLGPVDGQLRGMLGRMLIVDHHVSGDIEAAYRYVEPEAAACCEIVAELLRYLDGGKGFLWDPVVRDALFVGIASDTGWFRFSNTRAATLELAAELLRAGADHARLYRLTEQSERPEKLALLIRALSSLRLLAGGRAAMMVLEAKDFRETGAVLEETERFVDLPQMVAGVEVVVLVTETPREMAEEKAEEGGDVQRTEREGAEDEAAVIRLSFRSKAGEGAVDVAELAKEFGGGGHARAAGAKVHGRLWEVVERVRGVLEGL